MSSENKNQRDIWLGLGMICRLFRVNTGRAYVSGLGPKGVTHCKDGSVIIQAARPIAMGLSLPDGKPLNGTSDLNGWTPIEITQEMVGQKVAVFTAIETKRTKGGKASALQENYCQQIRNAGGIAGIARSLQEAKQIISDWKRSFSDKLL